MKQKRIVIQGAGIAGLTLAASLPDWDVTILEKDSQVRGKGAGILLHDESLKALSSVGVKPEGRKFERINIGFANSRLLPPAPKCGLSLNRGQLHKSLIEANDKNTVKLSTTVTSFSESHNSVKIELSDGSEIEADFLVGADGISSGIRSLHGAPTLRKYAGATCWRAISDMSAPITHPIELWGNGIRVGIIPLQKGTYLYITESREDSGKVYPIPKNEFLNFPHHAYELIDSVAEENWTQHDLEELDNHFWGSKLVPLIGDAAHAFTPNLGEGAAQAILDAVYLSENLNNRTHYPGKRAARNANFSRLSRWVGHIAQAQGFKSKVRDFALYPLTSRNRKA